MAPRHHPLVLTAAVLGVCGVLGIFIIRASPHTKYSPRVIGSEGCVQTENIYRYQRNELAKLLNNVKHELAMISCDLIEAKRKHNKSIPFVSVSGGWCRRTSLSDSGNHFCDQALALQLSYLFENQTVASFGDGPGDYKKFFDSTNRLKRYDAFDGAPYIPETTGGAVEFMDLTAPQYGLPVYDWVLSLEVAEHIPPKYEDIYIDNIVRHARVGIVLSWAVPGQGGLSHVNNKPLPYVQARLAAKGFQTDGNTSITLQTEATLPWLKGNVYAYRRRKDSAVFPLNA